MNPINLPSGQDALARAEATLGLRGAKAAVSTPSSSRLQPDNPCFSLRCPRPNRTKHGEIPRTARPNPHRARASSRGSDFQLSWTPAFRVNPPVSPGGRPRNLEETGLCVRSVLMLVSIEKPSRLCIAGHYDVRPRFCQAAGVAI